MTSSITTQTLQNANQNNKIIDKKQMSRWNVHTGKKEVRKLKVIC